MQKLLAENIPIKNVDKRLYKKDGDVVYAKMSASIIGNSIGEAQYLTITIEDITEYKEITKKQNAMEALLRNQQKLESIGTLASGVAHEINNPLNGILNYSQLISDIAKNIDKECESSRQDVDEYSSEIIKETQRISVIVKNLLQFSRNDKQDFSKSSISDIVNRALSLVNTIIKHDQITIEIAIDKDLPEVLCRSQQIQQVVMNLLTNAKDALNQKYPGFNENKIIEIDAKSIRFGDQNGVRITVKDYGTGIQKKMQEKLYDPFFTTKSRTEGTGLGLSISYNIIKEHNGELSFETEDNEYTKFVIDLPLGNDLVN